MSVLYYCDNQNVRAVVTAKGLKRLQQQAAYFDKLAAHVPQLTPVTMKELDIQVRQRYPDPPMVTFALQPDMPLTSGPYGHAGYLDLYELLISAGGHHPVQSSFRVPNSNNMNLETPTEDTIRSIFGRLAVRDWRER